MNITKSVNGEVLTLALEGWLDTQAAPELEAALQDVGEDISSLVFDCKGLEYISSSGIRQIVAVHKKMNGNFAMKDVSPEIMDVFNMTGISNRIKILG